MNNLRSVLGELSPRGAIDAAVRGIASVAAAVIGGGLALLLGAPEIAAQAVTGAVLAIGLTLATGRGT